MKRPKALLLLCSSLVLVALTWPLMHEQWRLATIRQTVPLTEGISMKVEDAWLYPADARHELLRVQVTYVGGDPNTEYHMSAEIGRADDTRSFTEVLHWQVGLPGNDLAKYWEFQNVPRNGRPLSITLLLRPKAGGESIVRSFSIPDRLRTTPHGEVPTLASAGLAAP